MMTKNTAKFNNNAKTAFLLFIVITPIKPVMIPTKEHVTPRMPETMKVNNDKTPNIYETRTIKSFSPFTLLTPLMTI